MKQMSLNIQWSVVPSTIHWHSQDFDDIPSSLDELEDVLCVSPKFINLVFELPLLFGSSLPQLWRLVVNMLQASEYKGHVDVWVPSARVASNFGRYIPETLRVQNMYRIRAMLLRVTIGDIVHAHADAIVNASNRRLLLGGGVSHALSMRFGESLQHQMWSKSRSLKDGQGVVTTHDADSGVRAIYHVASANGRLDTIEACLSTVFDFAQKRQDKTIILPALGTGTGGLAFRDFATALYNTANQTNFDGVCQLWCWTNTDFIEVCQTLDLLV